MELRLRREIEPRRGAFSQFRLNVQRTLGCRVTGGPCIAFSIALPSKARQSGKGNQQNLTDLHVPFSEYAHDPLYLGVVEVRALGELFNSVKIINSMVFLNTHTIAYADAEQGT